MITLLKKFREQKVLISNLKRVAKTYPKVAASALFREGERIKSIAVPLTPLDDGQLRQSAFVNKPVKTGSWIKVIVGYGGAAVKYALAQHEGPGTEVSPPSWEGYFGLSYQTQGTGKRFLSRAFETAGRDHLQRMRDLMAKGIKRIKFKQSKRRGGR